jgi:hypothetical protein
MDQVEARHKILDFADLEAYAIISSRRPLSRRDTQARRSKIQSVICFKVERLPPSFQEEEIVDGGGLVD